MATVPTGRMEAELEAYYHQWVMGLASVSQSDLPAYVREFQRGSELIIRQHGGEVVRLGTLAGFPPPREVPLSLHADHIYDAMELAAIRAGIGQGLNARSIAKHMFDAGMDAEFYKLERLARTEVVSAYWAHQWDQASGLDLVMVWSAESGKRTCPWCLAKDGVVVKDKSIRDHPNGRCTLRPTLPSDVPIRSTAGHNPRFTRDHKPGGYPLPTDKALNQALRGGLDRALVQSRAVAGAVGGMVSQGWTSGEAARYLRTFPGMRSPISREDYSLLLRALESYAQDLYDGLSPDDVPDELYHGGDPSPIGISSWTTNPTTAGLYAARNGGRVWRATTPVGLHTYPLRGANPAQQEYVVLGMPRRVDSTGTQVEAMLDAPTELLLVEHAIMSRQRPP